MKFVNFQTLPLARDNEEVPIWISALRTPVRIEKTHSMFNDNKETNLTQYGNDKSIQRGSQYEYYLWKIA